MLTSSGYFEVNVMGGVRLSRALLPHMLKQNWGRIIFISSESGLNIPAEMVHYGMTKTAQLAISRGLAESVAGTAVTVNAVLPGPTRTEGVVEFLEKMAEPLRRRLDGNALSGVAGLPHANAGGKRLRPRKFQHVLSHPADAGNGRLARQDHPHLCGVQ